MNVDDLVEILKVYAIARGWQSLLSMLKGELTPEGYLERVLRGSEEDVKEAEEWLGQAQEDGHHLLEEALTSRLNDLREMQRRIAQYRERSGGAKASS